MKFKKYIKESKNVQNWKEIINSDSELKTAIKLMKKIDKFGYESLIVGGFVRDILLNKTSHDIDLCTNMPIDEIEKHFDTHNIGKNKEFGIVVIDYNGYTFEIANYRKDVYDVLGNGKGADKVIITSNFKEDSARRDFTINSLGIDYKGNIIDHNNGTNDIENKIVTAVGDPNLRFKEDAIRILRGVRMASKLDFDIEKNTKNSMQKNIDLLKKMPMERIKNEFIKMASQKGSKFAKSVVLLDEIGILKEILPEITKLKEFYETPQHHPETYEYGKGRVYDHILSALRQNELENPLINLSILFHDIAKNELTYKKIDGKHTYRNHDKMAKIIIDKISDRLRLSTKEKNAILFSALNHMRIMNGSNMKPTKILKLVNDENWEVLKAVSYCDDSCRIGVFDKKSFWDTIKKMELISKKWGEKTIKNVTKIVDGKLVMKITGLKPSKKVGEIIQKVTDEVINNGNDLPVETIIKKIYQKM